MTDVLQYLVPILRGNPKNIGSSLTSICTHNEADPYNSEQIENDDSLTEIPQELEVNGETELPEMSPSIIDPNSSRDPSTSSIAGFRKKQLGKRKASSPLDDAMINYFKVKAKPCTNKAAAEVEDTEAQSDEHFLLSLKKDMKEMNSRQKRRFKKKIFDLIDEVLDDTSDLSLVTQTTHQDASRHTDSTSRSSTPANPFDHSTGFLFNCVGNNFSSTLN